MQVSTGKMLKSRRGKSGKVTSRREKIMKTHFPPREISLFRPWYYLGSMFSLKNEGYQGRMILGGLWGTRPPGVTKGAPKT